MKALISPNEKILDPNTKEELGWRVVQVTESFEVAQPLFWVDCSGDVVPNECYYDPSDEQIKPIPALEPQTAIPAPNQPTTSGTQTL